MLCNFCYQAIALKIRSCWVRSSEELGARTDSPQLVLPKAAQIFLIDPLFSEKSPEDKVELRVPIVVLAIDLLTALGQVMFQVPQICRLLDLVGFLLCFPNHFL